MTDPTNATPESLRESSRGDAANASPPPKKVKQRWSVQESSELYQVKAWGAPYFRVNADGHMMCTPRGKNGPSVDMKKLVDDLARRGINTPILVRFNDLLKARVDDIADAFAKSIADYKYSGTYAPVMPIKVNQQRHVVEELVDKGSPRGLGLEAGSKPELLVAIAMLGDTGTIVCNGYKDADYIRTALNAQMLGITPFLVVDRFAELKLILDLADKMGVRAHIGIRAKLSARGAGKWQESSGDLSKFGLSAAEIIAAVRMLEERKALDCFQLLHFHIGSQITAIRSVKEAIREASRIYCNLRAMGASSLNTVDVGGGLAIDYDGSQTNFPASRNYSVQEYANDIVDTLIDTCDAAEEPHPRIFSESGRALVAHHSVLIFNVLGIHEASRGLKEARREATEDDPDIVQSMYDAYSNVSKKNFQEAFNDANVLKDEAGTLFAHGVIDLLTRARVEDLYWATLGRIRRVIRDVNYVPDELDDLGKTLSDIFYCNFSLFQSLPDAWAVDQLFPILPIHRLDEAPTRSGIIADLTCDSDGKINKFIDLRDVKDTLRLHDLDDDEPYYLGAFLVGAYQETLGDLHNLFGDTHAVHVSTLEGGGYSLDHLVEGDSVKDVLGYVEYDPPELIRRVRATTERAVRADKLTIEQATAFVRRYEEGMKGYTYLVSE